MPKPRTHQRHLPPNMYYKHAAYYYRHPATNKWTRLGKTLAESLQAYGKIMEGKLHGTDMRGLFNRYLLEIAVKKSPGTYKSRVQAIKYLSQAFGHLHASDITPVMIYRYMDVRAEGSVFSANKEKSVLHNVLSYAIRWGHITSNPARDVKSLAEPKRERYIEDWEFEAVYQSAPPLIRAAMKLAYATGLRQSDLLGLKLNQLKSEGLEVRTKKTGTKIIFEYGQLLRDAIKEAKRLVRPVTGMYLLCTRKGQPYSRDGFGSIWQRVMKKALEKEIIKERFTFHDIRSKAGTDAERLHGREYARQLLGHSTQKMTARYIKGAHVVTAFERNVVDKTANIRQSNEKV